MEPDHTLRPDRNLAIELVRVTEAAAISSARFLGLGDQEGGDLAAAHAMRAFLNTVDMQGVVMIGKGEKEEAPALYQGERVGTGAGPQVDVAVAPVEGAGLLALGRPNALAMIAVAERGSMWQPGNSHYLNKIVVGRNARHAVDLSLPPTDNLYRIAEALGRQVSDLTVFVLDKSRHQGLIEEIRQAGARIFLHADGDVLGALLAAVPGTGVDVLMGVGGTPEGVITAAAVKALGGGMQVQRAPQTEEEKRRLKKEGVNLREVLTLDQLVRSDNTFFAATGITTGPLLEGVHFDGQGSVTTHSIIMRSLTGSIRFVKGIHQLEHKAPTPGPVGTTPAQVAMEIID